MLCSVMCPAAPPVKLQLQPKQGQLLGCLDSVAGTGGAAAPGSGHTISRMM